MKKTILALALIGLITGSAAIANYNGSGEGDMHIMSGGSSSASGVVAVGPDGTEYSSNVEMRGRNPNISDDNISGITFDEQKGEIKFNGSIQVPTPCHHLKQEVNKTGDSSYVLEIDAKEQNESGMCTQQTVMINYEGSFEGEKPYTLEVRHNGTVIKSFDQFQTAWDDESSENHFVQTGATCGTGNGGVTTKSKMAENSKVVEVTGTVSASNPCHSLKGQFQESSDQITLNVSVEEPDSMACVKCLGALNYKAQVSLEAGQDLVIVHDGEQEEMVEGPEFENSGEDNKSKPNPPGEKKNRGLGEIISSIFNSFFN